MFFYAKKIVYLSLYEQEEKIAGAGFASLQGEREEMYIKMQIKGADMQLSGSYPVYLMTLQQEINIGTVNIKAGHGVYERSFYCSGNKAVIGTFMIEPEVICAVQVRMGGNRIISGEWKQIKLPKETVKEEEAISPIVEEQDVLIKAEAAAHEKELKAVSVFADKWEQLKSQYKTVHPFEDEREFITIEPKDFVILREAYQRLVNNSFLLHGFYNYRHLILGRDYQLGAEEETCFYLGVPGVFFEREKMVAVMFGFEGFESAGPVEIGKFGYYLRRVEI